jgi:hypothetical protein
VLSSIQNVLMNEGRDGHFAWTDNGQGGYSTVGIKVQANQMGKPVLTYMSDGSNVPQVLVERMDWHTVRVLLYQFSPMIVFKNVLHLSCFYVSPPLV